MRYAAGSTDECLSYARDDCFPGSSWIRRVNRYTYTPVNAVWFNTIIGCLLLLLIFGGPVCIGAIFSVGALSAYIAFTIPIFIKTFFVGKRFRRGPWHLGRFSTISGVLSTCFTLVMMPIMCFPSVRGASLTPELMNWTCLVYVRARLSCRQGVDGESLTNGFS